MSNFKRAIPLILKHEGGYVDHPNDPGGATNKGITIATFRRYIKPNGTKQDLRNLTEDQAVVVYKRQYWDRVMGDSLPAGVDYAVADYAVNSGPSRAVKALQGILGVSQDGRVGPQTLAAVWQSDAAGLINDLCDQRLAFMKRIQGGKLWQTFGLGWSRRVDGVREQALKWADALQRPAPQGIPANRPSKPSGGGSGFLASLIAAILNIFGRRKQ